MNDQTKLLHVEKYVIRKASDRSYVSVDYNLLTSNAQQSTNLQDESG